MERYLIFDSGCRSCTRLAETVQRVAGDRLSILSIHDAQARVLLDQAYPGGWLPAPYLVTIERAQVRACTGTASAIRLTRLVGPRGAWQIWVAARRQGIYLPPGPTGVTRRRFLQLSGAITATLVGFGFRAPKVTAANCDEYYCQLVDNCAAVSVCGYPPYLFFCSQEDCYDYYTGTYCFTRYYNCACNRCN